MESYGDELDSLMGFTREQAEASDGAKVYMFQRRWCEGTQQWIEFWKVIGTHPYTEREIQDRLGLFRDSTTF